MGQVDYEKGTGAYYLDAYKFDHYYLIFPTSEISI